MIVQIIAYVFIRINGKLTKNAIIVESQLILYNKKIKKLVSMNKSVKIILIFLMTENQIILV